MRKRELKMPKEWTTTKITATFEKITKGEPSDAQMIEWLEDAIHYYKETGKFADGFSLMTEEV